MSLVTGRDCRGSGRVQGLHYQMSKGITHFPSQHALYGAVTVLGEMSMRRRSWESMVCILGWLEYRGHIDMRISDYFSHRDF